MHSMAVLFVEGAGYRGGDKGKVERTSPKLAVQMSVNFDCGCFGGQVLGGDSYRPNTFSDLPS